MSYDELLARFVADVLALAVQGAVAGLEAGLRSEAPARPVARAKPKARTQERRSLKSKPTRSSGAGSARSCGCSARGRHKRECALEPPRTVERSPAVERKGSADSPRIAIPVDETRAQRFARIEAAAQKRNGASA